MDTHYPETLIDAEQLGRRYFGFGSDAKPGSGARGVSVRISRGHPMPPHVDVPGLRKRLWRVSVVEEWFAAYEVSTRKKGRPGRPRKIDVIARERAAATSMRRAVRSSTEQSTPTT